MHWRVLMAAVVAAGGVRSAAVEASPAGMSVYGSSTAPASAEKSGGFSLSSLKFWESKPAAPAQPVIHQMGPSSPQPTAGISPLWHPIKYFSAAMSETPIATAMRDDEPQGYMAQPAQPTNGKIALDVPVGEPTPELYISLAQMAERQGNIPQARQQLIQAVSMWPTNVDVLRAAARMEDRQGQLNVAESLYARAVAANPQHAGARNDLGLCLARQGKLDASVQSIEQAVNLQPSKALYRNNAATVLIELRQDQKALAHLSAVHGPAAANYNMGKLLAQRNRPDDAIGYFQTAQQLDPTMKEAALAIAGLGVTPVESRQYAAEPTATEPVAESPNFGPQLAPQQSVPQPAFPATARGPALNASSHVPHGYYQRPGAATRPQAPVYRAAAAPRYLPPVQPATPGGMVR